jgi:trehalose utilization protein
MAQAQVRITVWNEFRHEKRDEAVRKVYPDGIHVAIADGLRKEAGFSLSTATLDEAEHGLTQKKIDETDVLIWWGHMAHGEVRDEIVDRVQQAVLSGMGLIVLHSGHFSKPFRRILGTNCSLTWREAGEKERLWNVAPGHEITQGIGKFIELPHVEMYGERFDIPEPDKLIFISWFEGGDVFRSGCAWERGNGRVFYFRPGHETFPIYYDANILQVLANACRWAAPRIKSSTSEAPNVKEPLEPIRGMES